MKKKCPWRGSVLDYTTSFSYTELKKDLKEIFPLHSSFYQD